MDNGPGRPHADGGSDADARRAREPQGVLPATAAAQPGSLFEVDSDPRWLLVADGWAAEQEPAMEGAFALVNGYLGTRAAVEEGSRASAPATFVAGVFDTATQEVAQAAATPDRQVVAAPTAELVVAADWSKLRVLVDGAALTMETAEVLAHRRTLDLRRGVLLREWRLRAGGRTTRLRSLRFASLHDRHVLGQAVEVVAEDWSGQVTVEAIVDGDVANEGGVRHLVGHRARRVEGGMLLEATTAQRHLDLCLATSTALATADGGEAVVEDEPGERAAVWRCRFAASPGRGLRLHKLVTIFSGRDDPDPAARAVQRLAQASGAGLPALLGRSAAAWAERWATADVEVTGDPELQRGTRFALYHLIGCASPDDRQAAPGARSLTGERYKGHVFWDNEMFVVPFLVFTDPPTARAVLGYRHHTLPAARENARGRGWRGAAYAWESADSGEDETPAYYFTASGERKDTRTGEQEHHLNADIGVAIWQYWQATGDEEYLLAEGAEILLELARFWASRAERGPDGRWHVRGVIGPDEYHEGVDDNAYTNQLAAWLLDRATELATWLRERHPDRWRSLQSALGLDAAEPAGWRAVAAELVDGLDRRSGLIEQHRGFHRLQEIDLAPYRTRTTTMDVLLGWDRIGRLKLAKQADVVMLLAVLGERWSRAVHEANFGYYEPLTVHDSSLSPPVHSLVAARLGDLDTAERYLREAIRLDLDFEHGVTAAGGVHIATLGGVWQALVLGFGGMSVADGEPRFAPHVPASWGSLRFRVRWRDTLFQVTATGTTAAVTTSPAAAQGQVS
jgi:trehalose/maltose hydrolase-like predicted phosphorylase